MNVQPWKQAKKTALIVKNPNVYVYAKEHPLKGRCLYAAKSFKKGDLVCLFTGTVVSSTYDTYERAQVVNDYAMSFGKTKSLMPDVSTIGGHLCAHSCEPNVNPKGEIGNAIKFNAIRHIEKDEELTIYYGWIGSMVRPNCQCGAPSCTGYMSVYIPTVDEEGNVIEDKEAMALPDNTTVGYRVDRICLGKFIHQAEVYGNRYITGHLVNVIGYLRRKGMSQETIDRIFDESKLVYQEAQSSHRF
jgi:hypothetical protein